MAKASEKNQPKEAVTAAPEFQAKNASAPANKLEDVKQHLLATGLKDNGFWWKEMLKEQKASEKEQKPFRRGRIWS
ncbi:cyanobactin biosynthesis PatC/TenC/TruC family protein [Phormidium nigroviride]